MNKNFWECTSLPIGYYQKNYTGQWSGSDTIENFLKNPEKKIWENIDITYKFSKEGFRTEDFESLGNQEVSVALGCSLTIGIGLPESQTWPFILSQINGEKILNLGFTGGSGDSVARILTNVSGLLNIKKVYILWPFIQRFEIYNYTSNLEIDNILSNHNLSKEHLWNTTDSMNLQRENKNKLIVNLLGKNFNYSIFNFQTDDVYKELVKIDTFDRKHLTGARDGMHWDSEVNQYVAQRFLQISKNID